MRKAHQPDRGQTKWLVAQGRSTGQMRNVTGNVIEGRGTGAQPGRESMVSNTHRQGGEENAVCALKMQSSLLWLNKGFLKTRSWEA